MERRELVVHSRQLHTHNTSTVWLDLAGHEPLNVTAIAAGNASRASATVHRLLPECPDSVVCVVTMDTSCVTFEFVLSFIVIGITCLLGLIGNILSIATLRKDSINSVTTYLLTILAIADSAFLFPAVYVIMIPTYCEYFQTCAEPVWYAVTYFEMYGWGVASVMHTCTVYVTVLVALHRYICVCRPHDARRLSGFRRAKIQVALVPVLSIAFNLPRFFEYRVNLITKEDTFLYNVTRTETRKYFTTLGGNFYFQLLYKNVAFYLFMYIIPLVMLSYLSFRLAQTLHARRRNRCRRQFARVQHKRDDNITLVLIIIIVVFVVCQTPTIVQRLVLAVSGEDGHECGRVYFYIEKIGDYMAILNSCVNFVIYVLFARHFRQTLLNDVLRSPCSKSSPSSPTSNTMENATYHSTPPAGTLQVASNGDTVNGQEAKLPNGTSNSLRKPLLETLATKTQPRNKNHNADAPDVIQPEVVPRGTGSGDDTGFLEDVERGDGDSSSDGSMETPIKLHVSDETHV